MSRPENASPESLLLEVSRERWLLMSDECSAVKADQLVGRLHDLSQASQATIVLEINCKRADFWGALRLHDAIRFLGTPVIGFVNGSAGTGALAVLQACETRIATAASDVFLQSPVTGSFELALTLSTTKESVLTTMQGHRSSVEQMRQTLEDLLGTRIERSSEYLRGLTDGTRVFISAGTAHAEGLIDLLTQGAETRVIRE